MILLHACKSQLKIKRGEYLTSGMVNTVMVHFSFSPDWEGLTRTAVFKAGDTAVSVPLEDSGECGIPWEVLAEPGVELFAGVYGARDGEVVLPTVWVGLGMILEGVPAPEGSSPPPGPGGDGGTTDHRALTHRDAAQQHPISAITGLQDVVNKIPKPAEALTNQELEAILK